MIESLAVADLGHLRLAMTLRGDEARLAMYRNTPSLAVLNVDESRIGDKADRKHVPADAWPRSGSRDPHVTPVDPQEIPRTHSSVSHASPRPESCVKPGPRRLQKNSAIRRLTSRATKPMCRQGALRSLTSHSPKSEMSLRRTR